MEVKLGYKQTEVGVIPEDWEVCRLDSLGSGLVPPIKAGPFGSSLTKDTYIPTGFKVYGQEQVIRGDYLYGDYFISHSKYRELESCAVNPGDVLLSLVGTTGKLLVVPDDAPAGIINPRLIRFSFDKKRVCPLFFRDLFETGLVQNYLARHAQGGTMSVLNAGMLRLVNIPLPTLPEQRAIAAALSDADALIQGLDNLIAKKRDIKQGAMQKLLCPKDNWMEKELRNTAILKARIGWQGLTTAEYLNSGDIYLVTGTDFKGGGIDWSNCHFIDESRYNQDKNIQLKTDDVLVTKDGTIGKIALVKSLNKPATLNSGVFVIRPIDNAFSPPFCYYLLSSKVFIEFLNQLSAGSTINHLYQKDFMTFKYRAPPSIEEQQSIASVLSDMDSEIAALEQKRAKTLNLKQGMMQELLTGRIRLI
jgi:type I restriction enzyme S subunit